MALSNFYWELNQAEVRFVSWSKRGQRGSSSERGIWFVRTVALSQTEVQECYDHVTTVATARISRHNTIKKIPCHCHKRTSSTGHFGCALFMSAKGEKEGVTEEEREKKEEWTSCLGFKGNSGTGLFCHAAVSSHLHTGTEKGSWCATVSESKETD